MGKSLALCALAALLACSNAPRGENPKETRTDVASGNDLVTSLEVEVGARNVRFVLHVTNPGPQPVRLEFPTGQRYDFVVQSTDGATVWQWSGGQMFTQMVGEETLAPGATRDFSAEWQPGSRSGAYTAVGRLTASNKRVEQHANFEIPKR